MLLLAWDSNTEDTEALFSLGCIYRARPNPGFPGQKNMGLYAQRSEFRRAFCNVLRSYFAMLFACLEREIPITIGDKTIIYLPFTPGELF